jgi:hypothetical protein
MVLIALLAVVGKILEVLIFKPIEEIVEYFQHRRDAREHREFIGALRDLPSKQWHAILNRHGDLHYNPREQHEFLKHFLAKKDLPPRERWEAIKSEVEVPRPDICLRDW